jgi:hypothetical protein
MREFQKELTRKDFNFFNVNSFGLQRVLPAAGLTFLSAIAPALLYLRDAGPLHPCSRASPQIAGAICTASLPEG